MGSFHTLAENGKFLSLATTSGGTTYLLASGTDGSFVLSGEVDTVGFQAVAYFAKILNMPTSGGVLATKLQGSASTGTGYNDLTGTLQTLTDQTGNLVGTKLMTNIYRPRQRFVSLMYQRTVTGFAATFDAVLYNPRVMPPSLANVTSGVALNASVQGLAGLPQIVNGPSTGTA